MLIIVLDRLTGLYGSGEDHDDGGVLSASLEPEFIEWYAERSTPRFHDVSLKSGFMAHSREHHYLNRVTAFEVVEANRSPWSFG